MSKFICTLLDTEVNDMMRLGCLIKDIGKEFSVPLKVVRVGPGCFEVYSEDDDFNDQEVTKLIAYFIHGALFGIQWEREGYDETCRRR